MRTQEQNHLPAGRLAGKTALITGTAGGEGRAAAMLIAAQGAQAVGCDIKPAGAAETAELVRQAGGTMHSQQREQWYPIGRLGKAEDIAYAALYLASDEASWVTGSNFVIDGGSSTI